MLMLQISAQEKVFKYMKDQNRPYSAGKFTAIIKHFISQLHIRPTGDVFSNMHKEFNKAVSQ